MEIRSTDLNDLVLFRNVVEHCRCSQRSRAKGQSYRVWLRAAAEIVGILSVRAFDVASVQGLPGSDGIRRGCAHNLVIGNTKAPKQRLIVDSCSLAVLGEVAWLRE